MAKVTKKGSEPVEVDEGTPLEEVCKENGWPIAFGCENGLCGTCIIQSDGNGLSEQTENEKQTLEMMMMNDGNFRLACQCKVEGDCTIEPM